MRSIDEIDQGSWPPPKGKVIIAVSSPQHGVSWYHGVVWSSVSSPTSMLGAVPRVMAGVPLADGGRGRRIHFCFRIHEDLRTLSKSWLKKSLVEGCKSSEFQFKTSSILRFHASIGHPLPLTSAAAREEKCSPRTSRRPATVAVSDSDRRGGSTDFAKLRMANLGLPSPQAEGVLDGTPQLPQSQPFP